MKTAVIAVDITNDFAYPRGGLPVQDGHEVTEPTNRLYGAKGVTVRIATRDKHDPASKHFRLKADGGGGWPLHGIPGTWGFEFDRNLDLTDVVVVSKGMSLLDDGYSAFEGLVDETGQTLAEYLREQGITHIIITGLATDYCVKATALDGVKEGFTVILAIDACRAVNVEPTDGDKAVGEMVRAGVVIATTQEILAGEVEMLADLA